MQKTITYGVSAAALIVALSAATFAQAQSATAVQDTNSTRLDEIIVTATKRPETMFDVPVAVTAYTAEQLDNAQVRDVRDLQLIAPTLSVNSSTGSTQTFFTIRGVGTPGQNTGLEQSVGVFIDGVYRGRPGAALGDLVDIAQIEVLRGPQGTLFGRNTSGGVINVRSEAPRFTPGARIEASVGDFNFRQARGSVTGPIAGDALAGRLTASFQQRDGYIRDTLSGDAYNDRDRWAIKGQVLWEISPEASLRLIADYAKTDEACCVAVPTFYGPAGAALTALGANLRSGTPYTYGPFNGTRVDNGIYDVALNPSTQRMDDSSTDKGVSAQLDWSLGGADLTVIAARRTFETLPTIDADYTSLDLLTQVSGQDITEGSLEVRLASADPDPRLEWLFGAFLFSQDIFADQEIRYGANFRSYVEAITPRVTIAPGVTLPVLRRLEQVIGVPVGTFVAQGVAVNDDYDYESRSAALFGHATFNVTEALSVTGGLRYSREEKSADYRIQSFDRLSQIPLVGPLAPFAALRVLQQFPAVTPFSDSFTDDDVSGTISAGYQISDQVNLFARYARGYKSGGYNLSRTAAQTQPGAPTANPRNVVFDPETVDAFELGGKFRFLEGRAQVNANLFRQMLEGYQTNAFDGTSFRIINAGGVDSQGLEWDYRLRLTDDLTLDGGGTWQDISYSEFANASPTAAQAALGATTQNLTGRTPNFVSDVLISGGVTFERPVSASLGLRANLNYLYRSEYATAQDLDPLSVQDGYVLMNASVGLGSLDQDWGIELWVRNLTDERVLNLAFDTPFQTGNQSGVVEPPRMMGVTLRAQF
jgi:outer membrane receptor protein involved in Fe transport